MQLSNHRHAVHCCKKCLHVYSSSKLLEKHLMDCCHVHRFEFPKDFRCKFTNIKKQLPAPFVVYADFESVLVRLSNVDTTQGVTAGDEPSIIPYQEHVACSYSYNLVSTVIPNFSRPISWVPTLHKKSFLSFSVKQYIYTPQEMEFTGDALLATSTLFAVRECIHMIT